MQKEVFFCEYEDDAGICKIKDEGCFYVKKQYCKTKQEKVKQLEG